LGKEKMFRRAKLIFYFLAFLNLIIWLVYFANFEKDFSIYFFNIGNGDGVLIETPEGFRTVIDGGQNSKISEKIGLLEPFSGKDIDLLILTHPHEDHVFGALEVVRDYNVKNVLATKVSYDNPTYLKFLEEIEKKNINLIEGSQGDMLSLGDLKIEVLYPFSKIGNDEFSNINNSSLVFRARYKNFSALFLGDIEEDAGLEILKQGVDLDAEVVKVAHQGAKNGSQNLPFFLERINPEIAVISVGKNNFGHPHETTIKRLNDFGLDTFRTDEKGDIIIRSDGARYWINTSLDRSLSTP
jgi:competence protein ComEC